MDSIRLVQCAVAECGQVFFLLSDCDHGHIYYESCRRQARRAVREASRRRYWRSPKPLRIARYLRVSKLDQDPALQDHETAELAHARGWEIAETYVDHSVSGTKERRPGTRSNDEGPRRRRFDAILVWRSDRLFRSLHHMVEALANLDALGVGFVSAREPFDTTTPSGRLMVHIVAAFAEFERAVLIERVRAGLAVAKRKGNRLGRPRVKVDVDRFRDLRSRGAPLRKVARALGCGVATLCRAMSTDSRSSGSPSAA
jgi:DNA invertase Pin-like site-specific DNA recombinase